MTCDCGKQMELVMTCSVSGVEWAYFYECPDCGAEKTVTVDSKEAEDGILAG